MAVIVRDQKRYRQRVLEMLEKAEGGTRVNFSPLVSELLGKRAAILKLVSRHPTPFYVCDEAALRESMQRYTAAFAEALPGSRHFYAMKVNHHRYIVKTVIQSGFGIDASSGRELKLAVQCGAKAIVLSGPGKTRAELSLALDHAAVTTVHLDSWGELERLGSLSAERRRSIRAGIRVMMPGNGWGKFGIPIDELAAFWRAARKFPYVKLCGVQFHSSWNRDAGGYCRFVRRLAKCLETDFSPSMRKAVSFVDLGGGFRPYFSEGYYPWKTPAGGIMRLVDQHHGVNSGFVDRYYLTEAPSIAEYAKEIGAEVRRRLGPLLNCEYYTEPGRIICNNAMHVVLKVEDVKWRRGAILDGGINIVGWERFEHDYFPVLNLTNPSVTDEMKFTLYGPLCLPQDLWGYYVFAEKVEVGDIILVPFQGALTYSLSQEFIKPLPRVYVMRG